LVVIIDDGQGDVLARLGPIGILDQRFVVVVHALLVGIQVHDDRDLRPRAGDERQRVRVVVVDHARVFHGELESPSGISPELIQHDEVGRSRVVGGDEDLRSDLPDAGRPGDDGDHILLADELQALRARRRLLGGDDAVLFRNRAPRAPDPLAQETGPDIVRLEIVVVPAGGADRAHKRERGDHGGATHALSNSHCNNLLLSSDRRLFGGALGQKTTRLPDLEQQRPHQTYLCPVP